MADIYRIGVSIAMHSNGGEVLSALSRSLLGVNVEARNAERSLNRIHVAALGLGSVVAGTAILGGMARLADAGKEFVHQQSLMVQAGIDHRDIAVATGAAWQNVANVMGSSASKNLALISDLRNQLGSMDEALRIAPAMTRMGVYLQNLTGQDQEKAGFAAVRFLDQRGALVDPHTHEISTEHLEQQARLLEAISAGTRGRVGPDQLLAFQQYARLAGATLSDQGLVNLAPVIAASSSPSSVGTQLASLQQQLRGGIMTQAGATWLENLGLMDPSGVHIGSGGHLTLDRNALRGAGELQSDPVSWVRDQLAPALREHGFESTDAQAGELLRSHLRSTVIGLLAEVLRNQPAFARDAQNIRQASKVDQYNASQGTDPTAGYNNFKTAIGNLATALGSPMVNDAAGILGHLAVGITKITTVLSAHPKIVEGVEVFAAAIGGLLVIGGGLAIVGAALGPFVAGMSLLVGVVGGSALTAAIPALVGLAGAITAIIGVVENWPSVKHWAQDLEDHWRERLNPLHWFNGSGAGSSSQPSPLDGRTLPTRARSHGSNDVTPQDGYASQGGQNIDIHNHIHLDGRQIQQSLTRANVRDAESHGARWDPYSHAPLPGLSPGH